MSDVNLDSFTDQAEKIIIEAGKQIMNSWNGVIVSYAKQSADIVTDIDIKVEKYIRDELAQLTPHFGFVVEEGSSDQEHEYTWSIDPIDGTKYFAHKVPMFYTQLSLLKNSRPIFALTYQPISNQLYRAELSKGAYLNGKKLETSAVHAPLERSIIDIDTGDLSQDSDKWKKSIISNLGAHCYRLRMSGGYLGPTLVTNAIHAYVNTDLSIPFDIKNTVDLAPHLLLVEEAGYTCTILNYFDKPVMIWSTKELTDEISTLLSQPLK